MVMKKLPFLIIFFYKVFALFDLYFFKNKYFCMFSKRIFIFMLLLITVMGLASVSANELNDDVVNDADLDEMGINDNEELVSESSDEIIESDEENDDAVAISQDSTLESAGDFLELQNLIRNSFEGASISLQKDYVWDDSYTGSAVFIDKSLTINGNGHTIDGAKNSRIFIISGKNVVLNDITFLNGYGDSNGGGYGGSLYIYGDNEVTTVNRCNFINSSTSSSGGAIATISALKINKCNFEGNYAPENGGAIYAFCPMGSDYSLKITDSTFLGNIADSYGGALYLSAITSKNMVPMEVMKSYITNSIFDTNGAIYGGAIFNSQYVDIKDSKFMNNYVSAGGGAIYMSAGALYTDEYGEAAVAYPFGLAIHGTTTFSDNVAGYYGGAIRISSSDNYVAYGIKGILKVYDKVVFESNYAPTGGALSLIEANAVVTNALFKNNDADEGSAMEGGIAVDCVFEGNTAPATIDTEVIKRSASKITVKQSGSVYNAKTLTMNTNVKNVKIVVKFSNGKSVTLKTNSKGVATYNVPFSPGKYTATITFVGNNYYLSTSTKTTVTIKKASPKISAAKKTFKLKVKTKKYTVKLKAAGKVVKNVKVTLKVKGKTYTAKTNSKGKATFKINKLKKKGKFKATIKSKANANYNKASKSVKITVK